MSIESARRDLEDAQVGQLVRLCRQAHLTVHFFDPQGWGEMNCRVEAPFGGYVSAMAGGSSFVLEHVLTETREWITRRTT